MNTKVLTKAILVNHINESIGLSKRECKIFLETFLEMVSESLKEKKSVKIVNFGIFKTTSKKERIGRNPKTKIEVMISSRNVVTFKSSDYLLNFINSNINNLNEKS